MSKCFLSLVLVLSGSAAALVPAQVPAPQADKAKSEKEIEKQKELEKKTLGLLDEVVSGAWGLKLPENRSFFLTRAADLLWTHDEKRARNLFWEGLNGLNLPAAVQSSGKDTAKDPAGTESTAKDAPAKEASTKEPDNKPVSKEPVAKGPSKEQLAELNRFYETFSKRREFLRRVAARDSQLALDMLRATRQPPPPRIPGYFSFPTEASLEQEIAGAAAARDPKRALQIARQSLAKGLSFDLMNLLSQLNQQDQPAASEFAADIIAKLDSENLGTNFTALVVATGLLSQSRAPEVPAGEGPSETPVYKSLQLSDDQKRGLVEMITDAALSATGQPAISQNIQFVMPDIEQYAPDRAAKIKARLADWKRTLNKDQQEWGLQNSLTENGDPEQMIRAADKMGDSVRESLYRNAVILATLKGRADSLRDFVNGQVEDESRKRTLLDLLDAEQIGDAVNRGKTDDLQKLLPRIRLTEQRVLAMSELAIMLEKQGQHDAAVELLDAARALIKIDLNDEKKSNAMLALMLASALVQPDKAFQMIEPIIDRANDDISKLLLLDRVVKTGATRNGEIILSQPGIPLDFAMSKYSRGIVALANADFNRTKSLADRFERNELRLLARLLMAEALFRQSEQAAPR
jgi:hypothetical protein